MTTVSLAEWGRNYQMMVSAPSRGFCAALLYRASFIDPSAVTVLLNAGSEKVWIYSKSISLAIVCANGRDRLAEVESTGVQSPKRASGQRANRREGGSRKWHLCGHTFFLSKRI